LSRPTDAELEILSTLWRNGPSTVREIHDDPSQRRDRGFNGTLKFIQIMIDKGYVRRDRSRRPQTYSASISAKQTKLHLLRDLTERLFEGSIDDLIAQAHLLGRSPSRAKT
jgi:predicted transcriptional regulator